MSVLKSGLLILLCMNASVVRAEDFENVYSKVDAILYDIYDSVSCDVSLCQQWEVSLHNSLQDFDTMDHNRRLLFDRVNNIIMCLQNKLVQADEALSVKDGVVISLEEQISNINEMVASLEIQLGQAHQAYALLAGMSEEGAVKLVDSLNDFKQKYDCLLNQRNSFVAMIQMLNDRLATYGASVSIDELNLDSILSACPMSELENDLQEDLTDEGNSDESTLEDLVTIVDEPVV